MDFRTFLEAKFEPSLLQLKKYQGGNGKNYLYKTVSLVVDKNGNIVPWDGGHGEERGHFEVNARAGEITCYYISPQSTDFKRLVKALKPSFNDIEQWNTNMVFMAGHLQSGNLKNRERTVGYWLHQNPVDIKNKIPTFYHGTSTNQWYDGIKKKGLMPRGMSGSTGSYGAQNTDSISKSNLVYLSVHPDAAAREASQQAASKHGGYPLILKIDGNSIFADKLVPDEDAKHAKTAQQSIRIMSTTGYAGRIPPSAITPFLVGIKGEKGNRLYTKWEKFKDVPVQEHPVTRNLKSGWLPYDDAAHYALKDAGIIGSEETFSDSGHRNTKDVLKRDVSDEEVKKILKNAGWAQNVNAVRNDISSGYRGIIYHLKDMTVPTNLPSNLQKIIDMLLESGILTIDSWKGRRYFSVRNWNVEPYAIKMAKLMGNKLQFDELASKIKQIFDLQQKPDSEE